MSEQSGSDHVLARASGWGGGTQKLAVRAKPTKTWQAHTVWYDNYALNLRAALGQVGSRRIFYVCTQAMHKCIFLFQHAVKADGGLWWRYLLGQVVVPLWTRFSLGPFEELLLIYYNYRFFLCGSSYPSRVRQNGISRRVRLSPKAAKGPSSTG